MKIYVAGKITGLDNYKEKFQETVDKLESQGHKVMNPAVLPEGFKHEEYMHVCYSMIDVCEGVWLLDNWQDSKGAELERAYALLNDKFIFEGGAKP